MDDIRQSVSFNAPIERVWNFLTDSELIAKWLMPNTFQAELGHVFSMDCPPGIGSGAPIRSVVTELAPPAGAKSARLSYTWEIDQPALHTEVRIELSEAGGVTRLDLVHSGWQDLAPEHEHIHRRHADGWVHLLGQVLRGLVES